MKCSLEFSSNEIGVENVKKNVEKSLLDVVLKCKNHIVGWKLSGNPVRRRTGTLARSIQERKLNDLSYELGSYGVEYAAKLEYNTIYYKYNRWFAGGIEEALKDVDTTKFEIEIAKNILKQKQGMV